MEISERRVVTEGSGVQVSPSPLFIFFMKSNELKIEINAPVETVFAFCINPQNTPKWVKSIMEEKTSTPKVEVGTVFEQKVLDSGFGLKNAALVVTGFIPNRQLDFHKVNASYVCTYFFEKTGAGTRLTYRAEAGFGKEPDLPLGQDALNKLKSLIEKK